MKSSPHSKKVVKPTAQKKRTQDDAAAGTRSIKAYFKPQDTSKKIKLAAASSTSASVDGSVASSSTPPQQGSDAAIAPCIPRNALVSRHSVEDLDHLSNIREQEVYQGRREAVLPGQLRGGVNDELLTNLPTCGTCRLRTGEWMEQTYGSNAERFFIPSQTQWKVGGQNSHFTVRLAVPAHVDEFMSKKSKGPYLLQVVTSGKYTNPVLRRVRWISTVAFCWLIFRNKRPTEVQTAFDGQDYYFTENDPTNENVLNYFDWAKVKNVLTRSAVSEAIMAQKKEDQEKAVKRAKAKALKEKKVYKEKKAVPKLDDSDVRLLDRLQRHMKALAADQDFAATTKIKVTNIQRDQHAETKLIDFFLRMAKTKGNAPRTIVVAGLRRPCFVCFARLQTAARTFERYGWELVHKERPGPYWPSIGALASIKDGELEQLVHNLLNGCHMYVCGPKNLMGNNNIVRKKGDVWDDQDTDSEDEGPVLPGAKKEQAASLPLSPEEVEKDRRWDVFLNVLAGLPREGAEHAGDVSIDDGTGGSANHLEQEGEEEEEEQKSKGSNKLAAGIGDYDDDDGGEEENWDSDSDEVAEDDENEFDADDWLNDKHMRGDADDLDGDMNDLDPDAAALVYAEVEDARRADPGYWKIEVRANDGGGDCLFHALEGKDLSLGEILVLRSQVAGKGIENMRLHNGLENAMKVAQALVESGFDENIKGIHSIDLATYTMMQALPGMYAGDDEIIQWCVLRGKTVYVVAIDGTVFKYDGDGSARMAGSDEKLKTDLHQIIRDHGIVLWKTENHFERVIGVTAMQVENISAQLEL